MCEKAGRIHAVALFSGGLDSILAARLIMEQNLRVRCLHFVTPFFGKPNMLNYWSKIYGLEIEAIDMGPQYVQMLIDRPAHGFGKVMNPCVDCKILMMREAKRRMAELGAQFIISGEVLGQRPMSQRRDTLNIIRRDGEVRNILLRPLCAQHLDPIPVEESGLVERSRLLDFSGRGRKGQLELAQRMGITEIPTPAGGCKLAEKENARRYWPVLTRLANPSVADFELANVGRQGWSESLWLSIGRNEADNLSLQHKCRSDDILLKVLDMPGPLALARPLNNADPARLELELQAAAAYVASCAPRAMRLGKEVDIRLTQHGHSRIIKTLPARTDFFEPQSFEDIRDAIHSRPASCGGETGF